jgi:hypothetical protein
VLGERRVGTVDTSSVEETARVDSKKELEETPKREEEGNEKAD